MAQKKATLEENLQALETLVDQLEQGQLGLSESLELYQKGVKLVQSCEKQITQAKLKVTQIAAQSEPEQPMPEGEEE